MYYFVSFSLWVSRVLKYPRKCLDDLTTFFMSTWSGDSKKMEEIEFKGWLFECRLRHGKNVLSNGLNWLCYFAGSSKSHCENFQFLSYFWNPPHQVWMIQKKPSILWKWMITHMNGLFVFIEMKQKQKLLDHIWYKNF